MAAPRICVLRAPGTNCDVETAHAFAACGGAVERLHLFRLLERPERLADYQVLCLPGGFSYGDDIGAGVILSNQLRGHLGEAVGSFLESDKLVLGICNGFQVLLKSGILPSGSADWPPSGPDADDASDRPATLAWNDNGRFTALWVRLAVIAGENVFLRGIDEIELPVAHAEGRLVVRGEGVVEGWFEAGQVGLCYRRRPADGTPDEPADPPAADDDTLESPHNPNGSTANIAGLGDPTGRVLGLMPHPERFIHATQHPRWTRRDPGGEGEGDGMKIFRNAVEYFE